MTLLFLVFACATPAPADASAALEIGAPAPDFQLADLDGNTVSLAAQKGSVVVLEWFNPGCPFVVSAHEGGPLETMAADLGDRVKWFAINSGAAGKQGHGADVNKQAAADWKMQHPILLDADGKVGRTYGATNTPQMVVIDPDGKLAYYGALDNAPRGDVKGGKHLPYTANAVKAVLAGNAAEPSRTKPWGCSVKY